MFYVCNFMYFQILKLGVAKAMEIMSCVMEIQKIVYI